MLLLYHTTMSVPSRFARLVLAECKAGAELSEILPWERKEDFLLVNPAGTVPVLRENDGPPVCGATVIAEYPWMKPAVMRWARGVSCRTIPTSGPRCAA